MTAPNPTDSGRWVQTVSADQVIPTDIVQTEDDAWAVGEVAGVQIEPDGVTFHLTTGSTSTHDGMPVFTADTLGPFSVTDQVVVATIVDPSSASDS